MVRTFIGITGVSTAGKSTLAATLLSRNITPSLFPIPHTTRRPPREDDDNRLIRCVSEEEYSKLSFLTIDDNYGTLISDYSDFLISKKYIAISVVSCNEVPQLRKILHSDGLETIFISLTLTSNLANEEVQIENRLPNYFEKHEVRGRIKRDKALAKNYFFNVDYLKLNKIISLNQENSDVLDWINVIKEITPIYYTAELIHEIEIIKAKRNK